MLDKFLSLTNRLNLYLKKKEAKAPLKLNQLDIAKLSFLF